VTKVDGIWTIGGIADIGGSGLGGTDELGVGTCVAGEFVFLRLRD